MPQQIVIIGADETALNGVLKYLEDHPDTEATVLYPELNPLSEFSCSTLERYLGRGIEFPERLRAVGVDRETKRVRIRDNISGADSTIPYDKLIFASGAAPAELDVPGENNSIIRVGTFVDAARLRPTTGKTIVVGNGLNMLLAVSALMMLGKGDIEAIEIPNTTLPAPMSADLESMVVHHLAKSGITIRRGETLQRIEHGDKSVKLITDQREVDGRRIINASSSVPVTYMAGDAGIHSDANGGLLVDGKLQTNDPNILACGSCASFVSPACKQPIPGIAVQSTERRQSHTLAESLAGKSPEFFAPVCAYSLALGDLSVAGTGLSVEAAKACGFDAKSATVVQFDRAHFMPDASLMTLELVFDGPTRRVVGIQGLGASGQGLCSRISAVSALLSRKPTIEDISNLEIAYSPPFASAMDVLNAVANVADNMLAGINEGIGANEFARRWADRESSNDFFLDCRELGNAAEYLERHPLHWNHIPQGELARRMDEVPKDRRIILLCNTGVRSFEAQVALKHAGYDDVVNVDGGMTALKQSGIKL